MLIHQISKEIRSKKFFLVSHILGKPIEYFKHNFQTSIHLFFKIFLNIFSWARKFAIIEWLVQIDVYLFKIIIFT